MDKRKENEILLVRDKVLKYDEEVNTLKKEVDLYNDIYKEISEIIGLEATLKIYLRFKGQQVSFPVRLYSPNMIQQSVIREYDGTNIAELAQKYDYSEKTIRRMIRSSLEEDQRYPNVHAILLIDINDSIASNLRTKEYKEFIF